MPNIDHLLQRSVEELKALSDEELMLHYASVFNLEPRVPVNAIEDEDEEEGSEEGSKPANPRVRKKREAQDKKTKMLELKKQILAAAQDDFKL